MKKTLAAVAVLGAFAGSAIAADVTLYGIVDMGLDYNHIDMDGYNNLDDKDSFAMDSGNQSGSRWGIKGTEELGNGLTVGFILEDGFDADDGTEDSSGVMFNRESSLFIEGGFGKLAFGRIGSVNNGQSSWALAGRLSAFGTSFSNLSAQAGNIFSMAEQWDNMIAYATPSFAGFKVYAQYAMGNTADGAVENESSSDRYYAIAATYDNGPFGGYLAVDSRNYKSWYADVEGGAASAHDTDDSLTVTLGLSYDFDVAKVYFGAQYYDEVTIRSMGGIFDDQYSSFTDIANSKIKGYSLSLSADAPLAGGKGMFGVGYIDGSAADSETDNNGTDFDFTRWVVSVGYDYPLSKRTNIYGVASYMNDKYDPDGNNEEVNPSSYGLMIGMRHKF